MTVIRSFGNDHSHIHAWCLADSGRTGKASYQCFETKVLMASPLLSVFPYYSLANIYHLML